MKRRERVKTNNTATERDEAKSLKVKAGARFFRSGSEERSVAFAIFGVAICV